MEDCTLVFNSNDSLSSSSLSGSGANTYSSVNNLTPQSSSSSSQASAVASSSPSLNSVDESQRPIGRPMSTVTVPDLYRLKNVADVNYEFSVFNDERQTASSAASSYATENHAAIDKASLDDLISNCDGIYDEKFVRNLFELIFDQNNKVEHFRKLLADLEQTNVLKNSFLSLAKLGHECFKLNMLDTSECLLELALNQIDTSSLRLKMASLSTLSACYWRQAKYAEATNCMQLELNLATYLDEHAAATGDSNVYKHNRYRIYGNLANAYERLGKVKESLDAYEMQAKLGHHDPRLVINSINSMGMLYTRLGDAQNALDRFHQSLNLIEQMNARDTAWMKAKINQLNLIGEWHLTRLDYQHAKEYFVDQLSLLDRLPEPAEHLEKHEHLTNIAIVLLNTAFIFSNLKIYPDSVSYYEKCLTVLDQLFQTSGNVSFKLTLDLVELYGKGYMGIINNFFLMNDVPKASFYSHAMLDFTLGQLNRLQNVDEEAAKRLFRQLKYLEMNACGKLASCYTKQNQLAEALKLHVREAKIAGKLNNLLHMTKSYSNVAQIYYLGKKYEKSIEYYKQILHLIEASLADGEQAVKDERLVQMIYFTLSNISLCMRMLDRHDDAYMMLNEQLEICKLIDDVRFKANSLLNLINCCLKLNDRPNQLVEYLIELFDVYGKLNDPNGQLFASQFIASNFHSLGQYQAAVDYYLLNIDLANKYENVDCLQRSLFNISLCYKCLRNLCDAYKYQTEYFNNLTKSQADNSLEKFISLGIMAELLFEVDKSKENYSHCVKIHAARLKLIKAIGGEQKFTYLYDCLEALGKLHSQMKNYDKVLKIRRSQLNVLDETLSKTNGQDAQMQRRRCRLWLDVGNLYLFKFNNFDEAVKFYDLVLSAAVDSGDVILESLVMGHMGSCKQKLEDYGSALDLFKKQRYLLGKRLNQLTQIGVDNSIPQLELNMNSLKRTKEIASIRVDMGRSLAKTAKCYELIGDSLEAKKFYLDYVQTCQQLHENISMPLVDSLDSYAAQNGLTDVYFLMKDIVEQIYTDYDYALAKLCNFHQLTEFDDNGGTREAIEANERRLVVLDQYSTHIFDQYVREKNYIVVNFNLAMLNVKTDQAATLRHCENIIKVFNTDKQRHKSNLHVVETMNLYFDLTLDRATIVESFRTIWSNGELDNVKLIKLKYETLCRLAYSYKKAKMIKECLEVLMESLNSLTNEFNSYRSEKRNGWTKNDECLLKYIEYLFVIHRRIALIHMNHSVDVSISHRDKNILEKSLLLALKHVNYSLFYLNFQKEFQPNEIFEFRLAGVYYLLGLCHKYLNNREMELEMFANSLDLYEMLKLPAAVVDSSANAKSDTLIRDKLCADYDEDEESEVNFRLRLDKLYQFIEDSLIRMNKLNETLLVVERHRSKMCGHLMSLPDLSEFGQIDRLMDKRNFHAVIYYSLLEISSTLNSWLLRPNRGVVQFHQIDFALLDGLRLSKRASMSDTRYACLTDRLTGLDDDEQNVILDKIYKLLIKPFELELFQGLDTGDDEMAKKNLWIIYDEKILNVPFHLLKIERPTSGRYRYMFELFDLNCVYSFKYMFKSASYNQVYTKKRQSHRSETNMPMRVVSSEEELKKLESSGKNAGTRSQFDLLLLLVNSQHKDARSLNELVNNLMSKRLCKAVLIQFNSINANETSKIKQNLAQFESEAKLFLNRLYSNMVNRTELNSSLIFKLLVEQEKSTPQKTLSNYLLFGNLGLNVTKSIELQDLKSQSLPILATKKTTIPKEELSNCASIQSNEDSENLAILDEILIELASENSREEITFSKCLIQFLNLVKRVTKPMLLLEIIVSILGDLLNNKLEHANFVIGLNELFGSFLKDVKYPILIISAARLILKRIGFIYYLDKTHKCLVKLPDQSRKLNLIYRTFSILQNFSSVLMHELSSISKSSDAHSLFTLLKQAHQNRSTTLIIDSELYKKYAQFFNEFTITVNNSQIRSTQLELVAEKFENVMLIVTILLNENIVKEAEQSLENYVQIFFEQFDRNKRVSILSEDNNNNKNNNNNNLMINIEEDETSSASEYSTVSCMLGFQGYNPDSKIEINQEIPIEIEPFKAETAEPEAPKSKQPQPEMFDELIHSSYNFSDEYVRELLNGSCHNASYSELLKDQYDQTTYKRHSYDQELMEQEFKSKSLVKLEEKEYLNHIITTTTTTIKTLSNEELFVIFDNDCEHGDLNKQPYTRHTSLPIRQMFDSKNSPSSEPKSPPVQINQNVYSCLANYCSPSLI